MNIALTRPQSLQELYKTYFSFANKFRFTDLLRNYIQNEEWKDRSQEPVWNLLSKISDDIGAVLTDDIVNYTRNVVDINTCKVPQMIEHASMLSYNLDHLKNSYAFFPRQIQCLIDVFSVNPEYLVGNGKNHILSDAVIKEILIYIRENSHGMAWDNDNIIDRLISNPHGILDGDAYRNFVCALFYTVILQALSASYPFKDGADAGDPIVFNLLHDEIGKQQTILSRLDDYITWIDRYIWNEIEYPLNEVEYKLNNREVKGGMCGKLERLKAQKRISMKFNPFRVADEIYFNGLNPQNSLSQDELELVEMVLDYHSRTKYDYANHRFDDDQSTQYAYYRELEFCEYVKMVVFVMNNVISFGNMMSGWSSYDQASNKFVLQTAMDNSKDCVHVVKIFNQENTHRVVRNDDGTIAVNHDLILQVSRFLTQYVFHISALRENLKTISHKHAMRGSAALLVHVVNDYLIKEMPFVRKITAMNDPLLEGFRLLWEVDDRFRNYGNVRVVEYEDDNEYFNIEPSRDVRFTERTNERYWEQLYGMSDDDSLGVLTKGQIKDFYRNILGMGRLQPSKSMNYDDVADFLVDLFKIGANPMEWKQADGEFYNPIDDIINKSEKDYGYTKQERLEVQNNTELRKNQERQFLEYTGNENIVADGIYELVNNRLFNWKNRDYSSHVLHPFMYNLKIWNRLNNIIVNGYRDYVNDDLVEYMSSKVKFDELFGKYGECRNFWKYNVMDLTGYTTRYEAAIKDEHLEDTNGSTSELTGYDGLFYPDAAREFLNLLQDDTQDFSLPDWFFTNPEDLGESEIINRKDRFESIPFLHAIYSVYWQLTDKEREIGGHRFYTHWYSHLNYTRAEYQKIAMQLWYWRDRISELITTEYPISKYCLDVMGNSWVMISTFKEDDTDRNPYLVDLTIAQDTVQTSVSGNGNTHVPFCDNELRIPSELWIRWKSNPIALPAFDIMWSEKTGDYWFDFHYRTQECIKFGQMMAYNGDFHDVMEKWNDMYGRTIQWGNGGFNAKNRFPVFFDMEQSANVLALASWDVNPRASEDDIDESSSFMVSCGMNPRHILSIERPEENNVFGFKLDTYYSIGDVSSDWVFDAYHYCPANGSLMIPMYSFDCSDSQPNSPQKVNFNVIVVPVQQMKQPNFMSNGKIQSLSMVDIDLNQKVAADGAQMKYLFDHRVKVCAGTKVVFSPYDDNGLNKMKVAFLGIFDNDSDQELGYGQFKVSSCDAKTRYEFDSQSTIDLSLTKGRYFDYQKDQIWNEPDNEIWNDRFSSTDDRKYNRKYIDGGIAPNRSNQLKSKFNSYDSNDRYVFVLEFGPSIDSETLFNMAWSQDFSGHVYNILGDAGYIPHFAYQSLIRYDGSDRDCGTAYTWKNPYMAEKDHMQFELLGLDDKNIPAMYENFNRMLVDDITDGCKTIVRPMALITDIYRIWCENVGVKRRLLPGESDPYGYKQKYDSYFKNEYAEWTNEELELTNGSPYIWSPALGDKQGFLVELDITESAEYQLDQLNDYYIYVFRTEDGHVLNEKRYILPPTPIKQVLLGTGEGISDDKGYIQCKLNPYQTSFVDGGHFTSPQVVFTGTQNPFNYDESGNRVYSRPEELQYGNGIRGVDSIQLRVDIQGDASSGRMYIKPVLKLTPSPSGIDLNGRYRVSSSIPAGQITVAISHKNLDNIAKYHILNRFSNLYFDGSLTKNQEYSNSFKYSDFKSDKTVELVYDSDGHTYSSVEKKEGGTPVLQFNENSISGNNGKPPYYYLESNGATWFLEQDGITSLTDTTFVEGETCNVTYLDNLGGKTYQTFNDNGCSYPTPTSGNFKRAHRQLVSPMKYADYLYVKRGNLSFKVSEESQSFTELLSNIPPFYIDEVLKNKLQDLNDVQVLSEYSTFVHQSEKPDDVRDCKNFNPLAVSAVLNYGVEQKEMYTGYGSDDDIVEDSPVKLICTERTQKIIELSNTTGTTRLDLQLEDGEIDDYLKIYTNYVRIDDGHGDWHYDLYFNMQNLFNSPFEYISTVTGQPNVLILEDSYLYLSGDKFKEVDGHNEIDEDKVDAIKKGGILTVYGQVKTYSNDHLSDVKTLKLFSYRVYNVSDDKPKFLIEKIYDITKSTTSLETHDTFKLEFSNVMWTLDENQFENEQLDPPKTDGFRVLKDDVIVVQPLHIHYNWNADDIRRITQVSFDIVNDVIDFDHTPQLCGYQTHASTLRNENGAPYYDHWSDRYMKLEFDPITGIPKMTITYDPRAGYNFETVYLRWNLPTGCRIMDTIDRLGGYVFSSTAHNVQISYAGDEPQADVDVNVGYVTARVQQPRTMYLGLEHSTTKRKNGYVIVGLADSIMETLRGSNPTLADALSEQQIKNKAYNKKTNKEK